MVRFSGKSRSSTSTIFINRRVSMTPIGQAAEVVVWRDRLAELAFKVTVGERERTFTQLAGRGVGSREGSLGIGPPSEPAGGTVQLRDGPGVGHVDTPARSGNGAARELAWCPGAHGGRREPAGGADPAARTTISSIDNQAIQSADQAVKILNQRADHVPSVISLDRLS